jgi:hypothetical protein
MAVKVSKDRYMSKPKEDLQRYGPYWKMIAKHGEAKQYKRTAKLFWRVLNVGPELGQRTIESACKKVCKMTDARLAGKSPFDVRIKSAWPTNIYDSDDEIHFPINDFDLCCPLANNYGKSEEVDVAPALNFLANIAAANENATNENATNENATNANQTQIKTEHTSVKPVPPSWYL